jgi:hypothetical protein
VQSLSTYARMSLDKIDRPDVDRLLNIRPAIAIEQKNRCLGAILGGRTDEIALSNWSGTNNPGRDGLVGEQSWRFHLFGAVSSSAWPREWAGMNSWQKMQ